MTALRAVKDWGWHLYVARYWESQESQQRGDSPVLERKFVESEAHADGWVFGSEYEQPDGGWPTRQYGQQVKWAEYVLLEESVERGLRFVSGGYAGGTRVIGAGWQEDLPPGWLGRGVEKW